MFSIMKSLALMKASHWLLPSNFCLSTSNPWKVNVLH